MPRALWIVLLLASVPLPAAAQPRFEISGGYSIARDPRDAVTFPAGWIAGAAVGLNGWLDLVADAGGQRATLALFGSEARLGVQTVMGGARASARVGRLTEFGQLLAGVVRTSGSAFGSAEVNHALGVQPGIGADWPLARAWAARAELDVRLVRSRPDATNAGYQYRFAAALVYRASR